MVRAFPNSLTRDETPSRDIQKCCYRAALLIQQILQVTMAKQHLIPQFFAAGPAPEVSLLPPRAEQHENENKELKLYEPVLCTVGRVLFLLGVVSPAHLGAWVRLTATSS